MKEAKEIMREEQEAIVLEKEHPDWLEEKSIEFDTVMGKKLKINRILYVGKYADPAKPKRCISITKNRKSVAWDIENSRAVEAAIRVLSKGYIPKELQ